MQLKQLKYFFIKYLQYISLPLNQIKLASSWENKKRHGWSLDQGNDYNTWLALKVMVSFTVMKGFDFRFGRNHPHSFQSNFKPFVCESKWKGEETVKTTSCKMYGTCCSALVNLNDYLFYHLTHLLEKGFYYSHFFFIIYPMSQNYSHVNHSFNSIPEKKSRWFVGAFVSVCVCMHPCELLRKTDRLISRGEKVVGFFLFFFQI